MVDWTNPALTQVWADFVDAIKNRDISLAKMNFSSDSNIPTDTIRWNSSTNRFEKWDGASWIVLASQYAIDVATLQGNAASAFAPAGHVGATGAAHGNATSSVAGFMSATDKAKLDNAVSTATANRLVIRDASGRFRAAAPSASEDVARKAETDALASSISTVSGNLSSHTGSGGSAHALATTGAHGFMSSSDKTKLNGIEVGATADQTASEILTALKTVDGSGSGLDADLLDGFHASSFLRVAASSLASSNMANGYIRFTGATGLMLQWLTVTTSSASNVASWPVTFPNYCLFAIAGLGIASTSNDRTEVNTSTYNASTVTVQAWNDSNVTSARVFGIGW